MTKDEFHKHLEENKYFKDPKEHLDHTFAVVDYYVKELAIETVMSNLGLIPLKGQNLIKDMKYFKEINSAFNYLVKNKNKFK